MFGKLGKGRFNLNGVKWSFVREYIDFKETESKYALRI